MVVVAPLTLGSRAFASTFLFSAILGKAKGPARSYESRARQARAVGHVPALIEPPDLPAPWGVTLTGDPEDVDKCRVVPYGFIKPYGFNPMERGHEAEAYVWAALRMTRRWRFKTERARWLKNNRKKDGSQYKALPKGRRDLILKALRPTTLLDFVYELRCKAHYQTVDEYAEEYGSDIIDRFHEGMTFLMDTGLLIMETQIAVYVGFDALKKAAEAWAKNPRKLGSWATATLDDRLAAFESYGPR